MLVVGDASNMRVHVHTDEPEHAVALFDGAGKVERLDVADMQEQMEQREARSPATGTRTGPRRRASSSAVCGVVAVAAGSGLRELYERLGAYVVEGGSTLNPSTVEILAGIHEVQAEQVIVFPNSANVVMAADRAAELSEKQVEVVESHWQQAGVAVLVEHVASDDAAANAAKMREALAAIEVGAVAPAARDDKQGRFKQGDAVGFIDDQIVAWGVPSRRFRRCMSRLGESRELITCFSATAPRSISTRSSASLPTASRSRATRAGSPTTGGC